MITDAELATHNPEGLVRRIQKEFPNLKISSYDFIDRGWDHEVLLINNKFIFRFPNSKEYLKKLKNEVQFLNFFAPKTSAKVPLYKFVAKDFSFGGYEMIPGKEVLKGFFDELGPKQDALAKQIGSFLSDLHNLSESNIHPFTEIAINLEKEQQTELHANLEKYLVPDLTKGELQSAQSALREADDALSSQPVTSFTHHDVTDRHLLWDTDNEQLGIIDFSDMCPGDPAFDFAELFAYGLSFVRKVYEYYDGPKDASFLQRALAYQRRVGVFMLINSFRKEDKITFEEAKRQFDEIMRIKM